MNVRNSIIKKLLIHLKGKPGQAVSAREFLHMGPRPAVDQAFSRLVRKGVLRRINRGLYEYPKMGTLFNKPIPQSADDLISAWAKKNRLKVLPSGAHAANLLGLSTQVPSKIVYYTNGHSRILRLGGLTMRLLNRGPGTMDMHDGVSARIIQALRFIGRKNISEVETARLRQIYNPKAKKEWIINSQLAPIWIRDIMLEVMHGKGKRR